MTAKEIFPYFDWESDDDQQVSEVLWEMFVSNGFSVRHPIRRERGLVDALRKAVEKNFIKTTFCLLMYGADPDAQEENGDTVLHLAVDTGEIGLVKALLACNADPYIQNKDNDTPLDIAMYLKRSIPGTPDLKSTLAMMFIPKKVHCREIKDDALAGDIDGIIKVLLESMNVHTKTRNYFAEHSSIPDPRGKSSDTFLLSLDGGGVRLFNVIQAITHIEERMSKLTSDKNIRLASYFDYIAGTSSGGIAACVMSYLKTDGHSGFPTVHEGTLNVLAVPGDQRGDRMDKVLQGFFTKDRTMVDLDPSCRMIITSSLASVSPYKLHLMTSYGEARDEQAGPQKRKVWEACRITSTAPTYFPVLRDLKLLDGGLVANNPTLDSMAEIIQEGKREGREPVKFGCVVSIGTGKSPEKVNDDEIELFSTSMFSKIFNFTKEVHALQNLLEHFMTQVTLSDGQEVARARAFCEGFGCQYFRLTPPLHEDIDLATVDIVTLVDMMYNTHMYYLDSPELIDGVAKYLLSK